MTEPQKRPRKFPIDMMVVAILILALVAITMLAGRHRPKSGTGKVTSVIPEEPARIVLPEQIGYREIAPAKFQDRVRAVAVGPDDHIFVSVGFFIAELGPDGAELRRFELQTAASCIAATADALYLGCSDHVEVLALGDGSRSAWPRVGENALLASIAVTDRWVVAGDAGQRRFLRWTHDGKLLGEISPPPAGTKAVVASVPSTYYDVATASDGTLWATEPGSFGVVHYDADGNPLERFGKGSPAIEDFGSCCNPSQVAVAPGDIVVTVEKKPDLVKTYHADGTFRNVVAGPKAFQPKTFIPDVAADSKGRVLVVDPKARSVRLFEPKDTAQP